MKKILTIHLILSLALFSFIACGKKTEAPKAGTAKAEDMLSLIPADAQGVFFIDVHSAMATEIASKAIQEDENYKKYQEFVQKTGIDPQKDIYYVAVGMMKGMTKGKQEGVAVINLKYDKETVLPLIKEKVKEEGQEIEEMEYEGITLYKMWKEGESGAFAFIDESNAVVGNETPVKAVLDIVNKKGESVFANDQLSSLIDKTNKKAMLWGAILIPAEAMEKAASENPMLSSMKSVNAVVLYFDYKNQNILADIMMMSSDAEANQKVVDALNGIKAFGSMAAAEKPEIGELVNKIEITAEADHVKIHATIPEELINKLKEEIPEQKEEQ